MSLIRSIAGRRISVSVFVVGLFTAVAGSTACTTDTGEAASDSESALNAPIGAPQPAPVQPAPAQPAPAPTPAPAPAKDLCPGGKSVDMNQPPYSSLTLAELTACLGETAATAIKDKGKELACLFGCVASGPLYPICAGACEVADLIDGVLNTIETAQCFQKQFAARPYKGGCIYPVENGNPGKASVGCLQSSPNGVFDPGTAFGLCRQVINGWSTTNGNSCADVLRNPISYADSEIKTCNDWVKSCVDNTKRACVPVPVAAADAPAK